MHRDQESIFESKLKNQRGLTLIELFIAIVIIGLIGLFLATIGVKAYQAATVATAPKANMALGLTVPVPPTSSGATGTGVIVITDMTGAPLPNRVVIFFNNPGNVIISPVAAQTNGSGMIQVGLTALDYQGPATLTGMDALTGVAVVANYTVP